MASTSGEPKLWNRRAFMLLTRPPGTVSLLAEFNKWPGWTLQARLSVSGNTTRPNPAGKLMETPNAFRKIVISYVPGTGTGGQVGGSKSSDPSDFQSPEVGSTLTKFYLKKERTLCYEKKSFFPAKYCVHVLHACQSGPAVTERRGSIEQ